MHIFHQWSLWQPYTERGYSVAAFGKMAGQKIEYSEKQRRNCKICGLVQDRKVVMTDRNTKLREAYSALGLEWQVIAPSDHQRGFAAGYQAASARLAEALGVIERTGKILCDIMTFTEHDEDCHINRWGDNQIPECTCGYTYASRDVPETLTTVERFMKGEK